MKFENLADQEKVRRVLMDVRGRLREESAP